MQGFLQPQAPLLQSFYVNGFVFYGEVAPANPTAALLLSVCPYIIAPATWQLRLASPTLTRVFFDYVLCYRNNYISSLFVSRRRWKPNF